MKPWKLQRGFLTFRSFARDHGYEVALVALVIAYTAVFSYLTILRYLSLRASAYDLGNYNQALFTAAKEGRFFYYTSDLPANPGGSIFGAHFAPIFFLLLPFYALLPGVNTLLVIQSFVLSLAAVPLFLLTSRVTAQRKVGFLFAVLYLLSPLVQGINWLDFHPEAFIPLGFLTSIYAMEKKRWKLYFAGIFLTLSSLEFTGVIVAFYGAIEIFRQRRTILSLLRAKKMLEPGPIGLITLFLAMGWTIMAVEVIHIFNPSQTFLFGGNFGWSVLGARSLLTVPITIIMNPASVLLAIGFDFLQKTAFFALVFVPFALFTRGGLRIAILSAPWVLASSVSNLSAYYLFNDQYTAFLAPFVFAAAGYGYSRLSHASRFKPQWMSGLKIASISSALIIALLLSPLVTTPLAQGVVFGNRGIPVVRAHEQLAARIISLIPDHASVLTQPNLFPLVSDRSNAFLFPYQTYFPPGTSFNSTLQSFMQESDFILLDVKTDSQTPTSMLKVLANSTMFGLYAEADGLLLYKNAYHGPVVLFVPVTYSWTAQTLFQQSGTIVVDTSSIQQNVIYHSSLDSNNTGFISSESLVLPPGRYVADFRMRTDRPITNITATLQATIQQMTVTTTQVTDVNGGYNLLFHPTLGPQESAGQAVLGSANFTDTSYRNYEIQFTIDRNAYVNVNAIQISILGGLYLDQIVMKQLPV